MPERPVREMPDQLGLEWGETAHTLLAEAQQLQARLDEVGVPLTPAQQETEEYPLFAAIDRNTISHDPLHSRHIWDDATGTYLCSHSLTGLSISRSFVGREEDLSLICS